MIKEKLEIQRWYNDKRYFVVVIKHQIIYQGFYGITLDFDYIKTNFDSRSFFNKGTYGELFPVFRSKKNAQRYIEEYLEPLLIMEELIK